MSDYISVIKSHDIFKDLLLICVANHLILIVYVVKKLVLLQVEK